MGYIEDPERTDPPLAAPEREMLLGWLDFHRSTLRLKCQGLTPEQLCERSVPPSSMSLIGLVRHMAEVERNWFQRVMEGTDAPPLFYDRETNPDGDFDDVDPDRVENDYDSWLDQIAIADEVTTRHELDDMAAVENYGRHVSLRWILVHMVEEYARHNGHADLLRERIDGATGD